MFRFLKQLISGHHRLSRCWMGFHRWSMPGGWCMRCGKCDKFFDPHPGCGRTCRYWTNGEKS